VSLWNSAQVKANDTVDNGAVQNADFNYALSLDDARTHAGIDVEDSLSLDLGIRTAKGLAKYLGDKQSKTFEALVDVSCTVKYTAYTPHPQETLSPMPYEKHLDDPRFTPFVAEVVEGGAATLSFVKSCQSKEEMRHILVELKVKLTILPVSGTAKGDI
jgi:hypothetical protein